MSLISLVSPFMSYIKLNQFKTRIDKSDQRNISRNYGLKRQKIIFCTYFDKNYLIKGLTMYYSLKKYNPSAALWVLCMDKYTEDLLNRLNEKNIEVIPLSSFEDDQLIKAKQNRSKIEYYWTCTPTLPLYVFNKNKECQYCVYVDADMSFYAPTKQMFEEMGKKSIFIIEHRYPKDQEVRNNTSGRFNVGVLIFKRSKEALDCLKLWRKQCLKWCYWREENGKMGDQMYLNMWPKLYKNLCISKNLGINAAPWNILQYAVEKVQDKVTINGYNLICYHFHKFRIFKDSYSLTYGYDLNKNITNLIYKPYIKTIKNTLNILKKVDSNFNYYDRREKNEQLKNMPNVTKMLDNIKKIARLDIN